MPCAPHEHRFQTRLTWRAQVLPDSIPVRQALPERRVFIDAATVENLELLRSDSSHGSLFGLLNKTATKGGAQLLKAALLQPMRDIVTIDARLDALDEILRDEALYMALVSLLAKVPKVCRLCLRSSPTCARLRCRRSRICLV